MDEQEALARALYESGIADPGYPDAYPETDWDDLESDVADSWGADAQRMLDRLHLSGFRLVPEKTDHIVDFEEDGYGLQHPLACRPTLLDCPWQKWLSVQAVRPVPVGRYKMNWSPTEDKPLVTFDTVP
jgi:hypothetical protein